MEISKINVNGTSYDIQDSRVNATDIAAMLNAANYVPSTSSGTAYSDVTYAATAVNGTTNLVLAGTDPIYVVTVSDNINSVALTNNPSAGHSCHVFFVTASNDSTDHTVIIGHDATNRICPAGTDLTFTVPKNAGGYAEVDFLNANNKIYVRGV